MGYPRRSSIQTYAIIPAAGRSRRMGRPKLLLPWGNTTVIEHVLAVWKASRVDHFITVLHREDDELAQLCARCGAFTVGPDPPPHMKDSILAGLEVVTNIFQPTERDAWLVAPADMPELAVEVIDALIAAHAAGLDQGAPPIRAPRYGGKPGHPVLFPWHLAAEVGTLADDEGLDALIARVGVEYLDFPDAAKPRDFDTPDDYERLQSGR